MKEEQQDGSVIVDGGAKEQVPEDIDKDKLEKFRSYNNWTSAKKFWIEDKSYMSIHCNGCEKSLIPDTKNPNITVCPNCNKVYCLDCDIFIHETLLSCPTCQ